MVKEAGGNRSMDRRIDEILMCESDRADAKERMHEADRVATILCRAVDICAAALRISRPIATHLHSRRES